MDCLVLPVCCMLRKRSMGYMPLTEEDDGGFVEKLRSPVTVVVGKEKREFLVDPFVLEENPFRILIQTLNNNIGKESFDDYEITGKKKTSVVYVDVDSILFEHMLWLLYNDSSSFFNLNLKEIVDFYVQDN